MAETRTARLGGLPQWGADTDSPSRDDFNEAFLDIHNNGAMFLEGPEANRPNTYLTGRFYFVKGDSDPAKNDRLYYDNGTSWVLVGDMKAILALIASVDLPIGVMLPYGGNALPSNKWAWADGAAISRTDYATLYNRYGDTHGAGNGSTTFNLPNMNDRFVIGAGTKARGAKGGSAAKTLSQNEMPVHYHNFDPHTHSTYEPGHLHATEYIVSAQEAFGYGLYAGSGSGFTNRPLVLYSGGSPRTTNYATTNLSINSGGGGNTYNAGGGQEFSILNPYLAMNWIVKVL